MVDQADLTERLPDKHILQAVADARYLLAYFSRVRAEVPAEKQSHFNAAITNISQFIASTSRAADGRERDVAKNGNHKRQTDVAGFWRDFIFLSDIAYPATIESIRYYFYYYYSSKGPYSDSRIGEKPEVARGFLRQGWRIVTSIFGFFKGQKAFELITVIALAMTVGLSLLSYVGSTALAGYERDYGHWLDVQEISQATIDGAKIDLQTEETTRDVILTATGTGTKQSHQFRIPHERAERFLRLVPSESSNVPETKADMTFTCNVFSGEEIYQQCIDKLKAVEPHFVAMADDLAYTLSSIQSDRGTLNYVLAVATSPFRVMDWPLLAPVRWGFHLFDPQPVKAEVTAKPVADRTELGTGQQIERRPPPGDSQTSGIRTFVFMMMIQKDHLRIPETLPPPVTDIISLTVSAQLAVAIINNYLLTLSFGFLGACVRVLRQITAGLENFTLAPSLFARYRARILLGMVAGPTIGLLFDSQGHLLSISSSGQPVSQVTTELSALAIAFVAGFSIEILFSLLDRLIRIVQEFAGGEVTRGSAALRK